MRVIYAPSKREKLQLRSLLPQLATIERTAAMRAGVQRVAHGFIFGRNPVTCAMPHKGFAATVCCDLKGWFDSVRPDQIPLPPELLDQVIYEGAPRQGLPTSPTVCNLAAIPMDRRIVDGLAKLPCKAVYTRYADDLTISVADADQSHEALAIIIEAAEWMGWTIAAQKTHVQQATAGRRIIVGIAVTDRVQATRHTRRRLRAARNQKLENKANGLAGWAACTLPKAARRARLIAGADASLGSPSTTETPAKMADLTTVAVGGRLVVRPCLLGKETQ